MVISDNFSFLLVVLLFEHLNKEDVLSIGPLSVLMVSVKNTTQVG
jgi:hypothetical protein